MQALSPGELPDTLNGIELRTIGREEVESEMARLIFSPLLVKFGMVVPGVISNDDNAPAAAPADVP